MSATEESVKKNRTVQDQHGHTYQLTGRVGEGGQGIVCTTNYPGVLIKITRVTTEDKRISWTNKVRELMRQPLEGLPIAHPLALITHPKPGYVMELMDGLVPMAELIEISADALANQDLPGYVQTGGLLRRLRLLSRLARVLAELHGRGLAYGDLSSTNVFISKTVEHAEVWLIDSDNISSQSRDSQQDVFTPDYGAPEIYRKESGINTLTDSWSFAVMAYRTLTLAHPLKGDIVLSGEPEYEEAALRGELPWVDHPVDRSNALSIGLSRKIMLNSPLRSLFERCFNDGLTNPSERPSLSEWADAFQAATGHCVQCESCGSTFFYNPKLICPFCDFKQTKERILLLQEYRYMPPCLIQEGLPEDVPESLIHNECWTKTGRWMILGFEAIELYEVDASSIESDSNRTICTLKMNDLYEPILIPSGLKPVFLTRQGGKPVRLDKEFTFRNSKKNGESGELHLGLTDEEHLVWRFKW
jgi:DNA-binding helix-hairpin-helix protein with protein kinase domain